MGTMTWIYADYPEPKPPPPREPVAVLTHSQSPDAAMKTRLDRTRGGFRQGSVAPRAGVFA